MKIGVLSETHQGERRVAPVPDVAARLATSGFEVVVEAGAGEQAGFTDDAYREARRGGRVRPGGPAEHSRRGALAGVPAPRGRGPTAGRRGHDQAPETVTQGDVVEALAARGVTAFSLDLLPRISRSQSMDALSSQESLAGYKAVLMAANRLE